MLFHWLGWIRSSLCLLWGRGGGPWPEKGSFYFSPELAVGRGDLKLVGFSYWREHWKSTALYSSHLLKNKCSFCTKPLTPRQKNVSGAQVWFDLSDLVYTRSTWKITGKTDKTLLQEGNNFATCSAHIILWPM